MRQGNDRGTQYRSGIYTTTDAQRDLAHASLKAYEASLLEAGHDPITTEDPPPTRSTTPRNTTSNTSTRILTATVDWVERA